MMRPQAGRPHHERNGLLPPEGEIVSQYSEEQYEESARVLRDDPNRDQTAWVGWIVFAATMMVLLGTFHAIQGLVALFKDDYYLVADSGLALSVDFTTWGWVHLIIGLIIVGAGVGLFAGHMWARIVGVLMAMLSAVANLGFLSAYPIWSALMILLDMLVIWAITVHGAEISKA
jgi:hypothetical protein